jgi:hypothetical protein
VVHDDRYEKHDGSEKFVTTFRKVNKIGGFFVFLPPILDPCCPISVPGDKQLLDKSANFANNLKNELFERLCFFWPFPRKMGREVGGNVWGYCSGGLGAAAARRV